MRCPSSVVRSSVVNFSHFRVLLWNHWTEFKETFQEARSQRPVPSLCFCGRSKKKRAALASDWLRHFRLLLLNHWTELKARSQCPLPSLYFLGADRKNKMAALASDWLRHFRLLVWNCWTEFNKKFSSFSLKPLNGICRNLTGSKKSISCLSDWTICGFDGDRKPCLYPITWPCLSPITWSTELRS